HPGATAERLGLIEVCQYRKLHTSALRLYTDLFSAEPKLADDLKAEHRYRAACQAALASAQEKLEHAERTRWCRHAVAWLQADLAAYTKLLEGDNPKDRALVRQRLTQWQRNRDLATLREAAALAALPADDREACRRLWEKVEGLRKQVSE